MPQNILVIDDEPEVGELLEMILIQAGYKVTVATSGREGLDKVRDDRPDLILLDVMMPYMNGWQVCLNLQEMADIPIIMLTVLDKQKEIAKGLQLGADDYIVKPFSNRELLARIHAVLRRAGTLPTTWQHTYSCGDLTVDLIQREVFVGGKKVHLTPIEFRLLAHLARRSGQVVPYSELISRIWGIGWEQDIVSLRWHMHNLRQKIETNPQHPRYLLGMHGIGYYCVEQPPEHR